MSKASKAVDSGLYQLVITLPRARTIKVGRHGCFPFPSGYYVYTGSAKRSLESRIARHLGRRKRMRWHIDYLLRYGWVVDVKRYRDSRQSECELNQTVGRLRGSMMVVSGFGSSDCDCPTHLYHFERDPAQELG